MLLIPLLAILVACTGCQERTTGDFFAVDFKPDAPLRYKMISERTVDISLGMEDGDAKKSTQSITERLEMVIAYKPQGKFDPYAANTIQATCESARVTRTSIGGRASPSDAVNSLAGKSYTFEITPTGRIINYDDLDRVLKELGDKAFATTSQRQGSIKNPDMTSDFVAIQWHLWDSVAAIKNPLKGLKIGQTWTAIQSIPFPAPIPPDSPMPAVRKTTYKLDEITVTDQTERIASVSSTYQLDKGPLAHWSTPYTKRFQMKGLFGFLRNYKFLSIEGSGNSKYNINTGHLESDRQEFSLKVDANFLMPLKGTTPTIIVKQTIAVELLD